MKKSMIITLLLAGTISAVKAQGPGEFYYANKSISVPASTNSFINQEIPSSSFQKPDNNYLHRSHKQKTAAWVLLGGGAALTVGGILTLPSDFWDPLSETTTSSKTTTGEIMLAAGLASMMTSIPFFIMSGVNKRKANVSISNQRTGNGLARSFSKNVTGITMAISIGK